jgi:Ni/Co efflux regulator RcnB
MFLKQVLALVAASTLAAKLAKHLNHRHRLRRAHDEHRRQRDDVHRWEAEGGNLPEPPKRH